MKRKMLVIDTETGGLDPTKHSLLSIAALVYHDGAIEDEFYTLVNEGNVVADEAALKINGLTLDEIEREGQSVGQVVGALENMLDKHGMHKGVTIVAHNAPFDVGFIKRLYQLAGRDYSKRFSYRALCTVTAASILDLAGRIELPGGSASLDNLNKYFNLQLDRSSGTHDALDDVRACAAALKHMVALIRG